MLDFLHDYGIYVVIIAVINTAKNTNVETQQTEAAVENCANE